MIHFQDNVPFFETQYILSRGIMENVDNNNPKKNAASSCNTVADELKKLNRALIARKKAMKLTNSDNERVFSFSSSK